MKPYEILKILESKSSEKAIIRALKDVPPESDFWVCSHFSLLPFTPWRFNMSFAEPKTYGPGVPEGIFEKITTAIEDKTLSAEDAAYALSKFSETCTENEWKKWYLPTLKRTLKLPFGADTFNLVCPEKYHVDREWEPIPVRQVNDIKQLPREFFIEPLLEQEQSYWFFTNGAVRSFYPDGKEFTHNISKKLKGIEEGIESGLVLVGAIDNDVLVLNDMYTKDEFLRCDSTTLRLEIRRELLENLVAKLQQDDLPVDIIESLPVNRNDISSIREEMNLLLQSGYGAMVFRDAKRTCGYPDILVKPETKSVITCTGIHPGSEKYENVAEYISGRGMLKRKKIHINAFLGLTFSQREQYLKEIDSLIGKRFEILSCGLRKGTDQVLFPIFKHWRNK